MLAFWRHGYETTSISDLTKAMGVTAPSIYTAFGDKKHLFLEAMRLYAGSPDDLERSLAAAPTAYEAARTMLASAAVAFTGKATPPGCLLASATASGSEDAADVRNAVAEMRRGIAARLEKRIERDVTNGILHSSVNAPTLALSIIATIQGMSVLARDGVGRAAVVAIAESALAGWPAMRLAEAIVD